MTSRRAILAGLLALATGRAAAQERVIVREADLLIVAGVLADRRAVRHAQGVTRGQAARSDLARLRGWCNTRGWLIVPASSDIDNGPSRKG